MAFDRRKMFFYKGVVETQAEHDQRMEEARRKYRKSDPRMTLAMMIGLAASVSLPPRLR